MSYICANCRYIGELDKHLRCPICQSDAVDIDVRPRATGLALAVLFKANDPVSVSGGSQK